MTRRTWLGLLLTAGALTAGTAAAQEDEFKVNDRNRLTALRDGKASFKDGQAANEDAVAKGAKWAATRITDPVNRGMKQGNAIPMSTLVMDAATLMVDPNGPQKGTLTEGQKDYIQAFGKAVVGHLRPIFGTKDKPSPYQDMIVRINAARILAFVGRSGYEESADLAIEVIENPKESDAVRLYALQALRLLFAVNSPDDKKASCVTKPERELKAIQALLALQLGFRQLTPSMGGPETLAGAAEPSTGVFQISERPDCSRAKAIHLPSGDHVGCDSAPGKLVSLRVLLSLTWAM